ncbi:MAG TPA: MazG nucleotide pyrophosphohydrolase domain-containing protein [bacterium]|nr:MazG nucleotide pyrophosphohydrolase domain-containing protein [bacterium]
MDIRAAQDKVRDVLGELFHPRLGSYIALTEEVGELADEIMQREIYGQKENSDDMGKEMADILVCLLELATRYNIDLESAFAAKFAAIEGKVPQWREKFGPSLATQRARLD